MAELIVQQIPIPKEEKDLLKDLAKAQGLDIYELIDQITDWYLSKSKPSMHQILTTPRGSSVYWSFLVYPTRLKEVEELAIKFETSNNRIWYTAIKKWLMHRKLLEIPS